VAADFLGDILGEAAGVAIRKGLRGRNEPLQVGCAFRVTNGSLSGLTARWRTGVGAVSPGAIDFHPGAKERVVVRTSSPHAIRIRPVSVAATASVDEPRPGLTICRVVTEAAALEWAIPAPRLDDLLARLRTSRSKDPQHAP
jgi:hypothetical protein